MNPISPSISLSAAQEPRTVSVIIPTYLAERTLANCLRSLQQQTAMPDEIIVVDAGSPDRTVSIAESFNVTVLTTTPNRSAQRNLGADHARGDFVMFIDADMELTPSVIENCLNESRRHPEYFGLVIPEESFGTTFWAAVKAFERSFYQGVDFMEGARWMARKTFLTLGGYDAALLGGEDWDLDERLRHQGSIGRVTAIIRHNEGALSLRTVRTKKGHYAETLTTYAARYPERAAQQLTLSSRVRLFLSRPYKLARHPAFTAGLVVMGVAQVLAAKRPILTANDPLNVEKPRVD